MAEQVEQFQETLVTNCKYKVGDKSLWDKRESAFTIEIVTLKTSTNFLLH